MFKILEVDLDHVQRTVAGLRQLLDGDKLPPYGRGTPGRGNSIGCFPVWCLNVGKMMLQVKS